MYYRMYIVENFLFSGRILNRFSKDMGAVDELLPRAMIDALQILLVMSGILAMVMLVNPWMIIPMVIIGFIFYGIRTMYLATAQDIKRLEGISMYIVIKFPIFLIKDNFLTVFRFINVSF